MSYGKFGASGARGVCAWDAASADIFGGEVGDAVSGSRAAHEEDPSTHSCQEVARGSFGGVGLPGRDCASIVLRTADAVSAESGETTFINSVGYTCRASFI